MKCQKINNLKVLSLLVGGLLFGCPSQGASSLVSLGVQGGLSLATTTTPSQITSSSFTGFLVGARLEVPLRDVFYLQPEVNYARKGVNLVDDTKVKVEASYDSIEVPIFLKAKMGRAVKPYIMAGPNFIFNVADRVQTDGPGQKTTVSFNPRTVTYALDIGTGLEVGPLVASLRYSIGFSTLTPNSASWKPRSALVMLGYQFGGGSHESEE